MNETHLYIGDDIIDLAPGQVVAISIKKIDIGNLNNRFVDFSNQLKAVKSESNLVKLGYSHREQSTSSVPYSLQNGKIVQGGLEIIPNANVIIRNVNKEFTINVYESAYDFFSRIKGLSIADINPIAASGWEVSNIDSARLNTEGIVTVVLNWGKAGAIYQSTYFLPCFYYHTIVTSILEYTGLTLSGDILTDARFTDLAMPYPGDRFEYHESITTQNNAKVSLSVQTQMDTMTAINPSGFNAFTYAMPFNTRTYGVWDVTDSLYRSYSVAATSNINVSVTCNISDVVWGTGTILTYKLYRLRAGAFLLLTGVGGNVVTSPATSGSSTTDEDFDFIEGDQIFATVESDAADGSDVWEIGTASIAVINVNTTVNRANVMWNLLWPDIKCDSILRDFFTRFSIIPKLVGQTLYLKSIEDICNDRAGATDWSDKLVKSDDDDIDFDLKYAANNYFTYADSEFVKDPALGRGNLEVENTVIEESKTVLQSPFEKCNTGFQGVYNVATIPVYDTTSTGIATFANKPGIKLLTLKDRTTETAITFNVAARTDYKLGYFVDPTLSKDTGWEYFLGQFYPSLEASLQRNKVVTKQFALTPLDIANYDSHKMIFDGVGYYLVNKIPNFIAGRITSVELFKVG